MSPMLERPITEVTRNESLIKKASRNWLIIASASFERNMGKRFSARLFIKLADGRARMHESDANPTVSNSACYKSGQIFCDKLLTGIVFPREKVFQKRLSVSVFCWINIEIKFNTFILRKCIYFVTQRWHWKFTFQCIILSPHRLCIFKFVRLILLSAPFNIGTRLINIHAL